MKNTLFKYGIIFTALILFSCSDGNYVNVSLSGHVKDIESNEAISNAKVYIICWVYDTEIWESKKVKKETLTDNNGFYTLSFDKGEAMDIEINSNYYESEKVSITLKKSKNEMNFFLKKK